jgi:hypothetical protein
VTGGTKLNFNPFSVLITSAGNLDHVFVHRYIAAYVATYNVYEIRSLAVSQLTRLLHLPYFYCEGPGSIPEYVSFVEDNVALIEVFSFDNLRLLLSVPFHQRCVLDYDL